MFDFRIQWSSNLVRMLEQTRLLSSFSRTRFRQMALAMTKWRNKVKKKKKWIKIKFFLSSFFFYFSFLCFSDDILMISDFNTVQKIFKKNDANRCIKNELGNYYYFFPFFFYYLFLIKTKKTYQIYSSSFFYSFHVIILLRFN